MAENEIERVEMSINDWEIVEVCAEIECPYCQRTDVYYNSRPYFPAQLFTCDSCGKQFFVRSDF